MLLTVVGGLSLKADIISKLNMKLIVLKMFICLKIKKINFKIICNYTIFENKFLCFFQTLGNKMRYLPKVAFFQEDNPNVKTMTEPPIRRYFIKSHGSPKFITKEGQ